MKCTFIFTFIWRAYKILSWCVNIKRFRYWAAVWCTRRFMPPNIHTPRRQRMFWYWLLFSASNYVAMAIFSKTSICAQFLQQAFRLYGAAKMTLITGHDAERHMLRYWLSAESSHFSRISVRWHILSWQSYSHSIGRPFASLWASMTLHASTCVSVKRALPSVAAATCLVA